MLELRLFALLRDDPLFDPDFERLADAVEEDFLLEPLLDDLLPELDFLCAIDTSPSDLAL